MHMGQSSECYRTTCTRACALPSPPADTPWSCATARGRMHVSARRLCGGALQREKEGATGREAEAAHQERARLQHEQALNLISVEQAGLFALPSVEKMDGESSRGGAGQLCAPSTVLTVHPRTQERESWDGILTAGVLRRWGVESGSIDH